MLAAVEVEHTIIQQLVEMVDQVLQVRVATQILLQQLLDKQTLDLVEEEGLAVEQILVLHTKVLQAVVE